MGWGDSWSDTIENFKLTDPVPFEGDKLATKTPYTNVHPTHDPYTNPNAHIYYECGCGAILDPKTKSFAALNNYASEKGWKIRFGHDSYVPYCDKCGEEVE
jgi:hypothetical protein